MSAFMGNATKYKSMYSGSLRLIDSKFGTTFLLHIFSWVLQTGESQSGLTVHTAGVKYFQHSLKMNRGILPVMCLMLALKRSAPVGENNFIMISPQLEFNLWLV